jgi:hypothetical protein
MTPGLAHAALALLLQALVALPLAFALRIDAVAALLTGGVLAAVVGMAFALGFYAGRERRQTEEHYGSNRIPPWWWKPRALRDFAWPALAVLVATAAVAITRAT